MFDYLSLSGSELISVSGSGSFDVGSGDFATNFNAGTYGFAGDSGIDFQVNVGSPPAQVPVPGIAWLFAAGLLGIAHARRAAPKKV